MIPLIVCKESPRCFYHNTTTFILMKQLLYTQHYSEKLFRKEQPFIINRSTILLLLLLVIGLIISLPVDAQDILTGLTSNGGPDGMGTAFSIKSTGANFSIMKTFAD